MCVRVHQHVRAQGKGITDSINILNLPVITSTHLASTVKKVILNELLAFISYYRNNSAASTLCDVILNHFSAEDVSVAKHILVHEFQMIAGASQFLNERRSSSVRSAREAELADVIGIFQAVDASRPR